MSTAVRSPAKIARRMTVLPLAARRIENWPQFVKNYALGLVPRTAYSFREGARLRIARGVDHVPIIEVFLRRDYGVIPERSLVVDLGASFGVFAIYATATARDVRVYAYEPDPAAFSLLEANVALNGKDGAIECFRSAVAGDAGERTLYLQGAGLYFATLVPRDEARAERRSVPCTTLAQIIERNGLPRIDLLKVDIEGAEYELLYGSPTECLSRIEEIRMETHELDTRERNAATLRRFLERNGFRITRYEASSDVNHVLWARRDTGRVDRREIAGARSA